MPCSHCAAYLLKIGIRHTIYSTNEGTLEYSKLDKLACHYSSGNRY